MFTIKAILAFRFNGFYSITRILRLRHAEKQGAEDAVQGNCTFESRWLMPDQDSENKAVL